MAKNKKAEVVTSTETTTLTAPEVVGAANEKFMSQPTTQTEIVMKVSQSDIVDMVVSEHEERLEAALEAAKAKHKELSEKLATTDLSKVAKEYVTENYPKLLEGLKSIAENKDFSFGVQFDYHNFYVKDKDKDTVLLVVGFQTNYHSSDQITFKEKKSALLKNKVVAEFFALKKELEKANEQVSQAQQELRGVGALGKRAKAALVKEILGSSNAGKDLLKRVQAASSNVKLLS